VTVPPLNLAPAFGFMIEVERAYDAMISSSAHAGVSEAGTGPGLGGRLLYAGELDDAGRALVVAGNIAGAATLAAASDPAMQKQAIRDGVVDFLVTTLDEALRILKNEIRKGETVAVCVAAAPEAVQSEMTARGVAPNLLRDEVLRGRNSSARGGVSVSWRVATAPAQWLPRLDAIAADCLSGEAASARRWLRLAPRYLGRMAHGERLVSADANFARRFLERVRHQVAVAQITVPVTVRVWDAAGCEEHRFASAIEPVAGGVNRP
jgi:hypothetical protein